MIKFTKGPGKTRLSFGGRCVTGPPGGYAHLLWAWILGPFTLWAGLVAPSLWRFSRASVLFMPALLLLTAASFLITACRDPGIIPQRSALYQPDASKPISRWCTRCSIEKPSRAYHCSVCDICVLRMDHHCPVIGTCIAGRNIAAFYAFNVVATTMMYFAISTGILVIVVKHSSQTGESGWTGRAVIAMLALAVLSVGCGAFMCARLYYQCCCYPAALRTAATGRLRRVPLHVCGVELRCFRSPISMLADAIHAADVGRGRATSDGTSDGGGDDALALAVAENETSGADV